MTTTMLLWFFVTNASSYLLMCEDHTQARFRGSRVPHKTFFVLAFMGGALGIAAAMYRKCHKKNNPSFFISVIVLLFINIVMYTYLLH